MHGDTEANDLFSLAGYMTWGQSTHTQARRQTDTSLCIETTERDKTKGPPHTCIHVYICICVYHTRAKKKRRATSGGVERKTIENTRPASVEARLRQ